MKAAIYILADQHGDDNDNVTLHMHDVSATETSPQHLFQLRQCIEQSIVELSYSKIEYGRENSSPTKNYSRNTRSRIIDQLKRKKQRTSGLATARD